MNRRLMDTVLATFLICITLQSSCQSNKTSPSKQSPTSNSKEVNTSSGSLNAKIGAVYAKEGEPGTFDVDIRIKEGSLKTGDKVDVVSADGKHFPFTVKSMRNPYENITTANKESGTIYIILSGNREAKFDADFALVNQGASNSAAPTTSTAKFTSVINGKQWKGKDFPYSFSLFKKGVKNFSDNKPYLLLAFKSMDAVDDRTLTIIVFTTDASPGVYTKDKIEILLSGSPKGDTKNPEMWGYKFPATVSGNMKVEITSFKETGNGRALISGNISGDLKKVLGTGKMPLEDGKFTNLEIDVYNEMYLNKKS